MPTRLLVAALATALIGLALFVFLPDSNEAVALSEQEEYEAYLAQHPYAQRAPMTEEEIKALPKMDRPDLAAEQNFLLTMDPVTRTIPIAQLFDANRRATAYKRTQGGPLVTGPWEERGPSNVGGRTRAVMFDPNDAESKKVWAGGVGGGLWFTNDITDEDAEWSNVDDFWANIAISAIAYDLTDTQVFYAGTGEGWFNGDAIRGGGIFKSTDGGETWDQLDATTASIFQNVQDLLVHPTTGDVYAATREGGLQRSEDGGETWAQVLGAGNGASSSRAADIEISADGETIYASFGIFNPGALYSSSTGDAGDWDTLSDNPGFPTSGYARVEIATAPSDADIVYVVTHLLGNNGLGSIYRSDDAGATWTTAGSPIHPQFPTDASNGQAWYDLILAVAPEDPALLLLGAVDLHRSDNGGTTWELISSAYGVPNEPDVHPDHHNIIFRPGFPDEAIFSHDGGIDYSTDATAQQPTYLNRNNGYNVTQFYAGALAPEEGSNVMLAGAQDNGTWRFSTEGINEARFARGGDGTFTFIDDDQSAIAIASSQFNNYFRSANGGFTFSFPLISQQNGSFINPAAYDDREDILYTNLNASAFYRVTGVATSSPTLTTVSRPFSSTPTHLKVSPFSPANSSTLYIGTGAGRIFRIRNAQTTAISTELTTNGVNAGAVSNIAFGESEDQLLLTFSNYFTSPASSQVWETLDGGTTWVSKQGNLPNIPVRWSLYNPTNRNAVLLATEAGVWETTNFGDDEPTWTPAPGFPTTRVDMLQTRASDNLVMAATHGRGVFTAPFELFAVSAEDDAAVAGTHRLDAAYPNPFQREASFSLRVAQAQNVRVEVFNTAGQRVAVLHDGPLPAESPQRFTVDGAGLASGTYLYVVTGERFRDEGRVTLVR